MDIRAEVKEFKSADVPLMCGVELHQERNGKTMSILFTLESKEDAEKFRQALAVLVCEYTMDRFTLE